MLENRNSLQNIFDQDALSLGRILKTIQRTDDVVISELLRTDEINQSAVFRTTAQSIHAALYELESLVVKAQGALRLPESLVTESEVF